MFINTKPLGVNRFTVFAAVRCIKCALRRVVFGYMNIFVIIRKKNLNKISAHKIANKPFECN